MGKKRRPQAPQPVLHQDGWSELESDPKLFSSLLADLGVKGVDVEEIYDLERKIEGPVYGFIFLSQLGNAESGATPSKRRRSKQRVVARTFVEDEDVINDMFFARQTIANSCATLALLSVVLNAEDVQLGEILDSLKQTTRHMAPEDKGNAIRNFPQIAEAHNRLTIPPESDSDTNSSNVLYEQPFHYVSFIPLNRHLYELDGLQDCPIDHGLLPETGSWTELFSEVLGNRLKSSTSLLGVNHDIRYNLMAVVPVIDSDCIAALQFGVNGSQDVKAEETVLLSDYAMIDPALPKLSPAQRIEDSEEDTNESDCPPELTAEGLPEIDVTKDQPALEEEQTEQFATEETAESNESSSLEQPPTTFPKQFEQFIQSQSNDDNIREEPPCESVNETDESSCSQTCDSPVSVSSARTPVIVLQRLPETYVNQLLCPKSPSGEEETAIHDTASNSPICENVQPSLIMQNEFDEIEAEDDEYQPPALDTSDEEYTPFTESKPPRRQSGRARKRRAYSSSSDSIAFEDEASSQSYYTGRASKVDVISDVKSQNTVVAALKRQRVKRRHADEDRIASPLLEEGDGHHAYTDNGYCKTPFAVPNSDTFLGAFAAFLQTYKSH